MVNKGILTKNYYIDPDAVAELGAEIESVMTETDRAMEDASKIIAEIASLTERVPSEIRCGALLELCAVAQEEIRSFDFLSYGKRVNQGLLNLIDHNQYITEHFIKNMRANTERMHGLEEEFRRLADSITYSREDVQAKGIKLSTDGNLETTNIDVEEENLPGQGNVEGTGKGEEGSVELDMTGWDAMFPRAGAAVVLDVEIREPEDDIYCQQYVNEDILETLGWNLEAARACFGDDFIEKMRRLMLQYGMTDERSVSMFLMTCTHECGRGMAKLEERADFSGASYTVNTRGAGMIQVTGADQKAFLEYILDYTTDGEEREIISRYISGFINSEEPSKDAPCDNSYHAPGTEENRGDQDESQSRSVSDFIADNYAIEAAVWYWCRNGKIEIDGEVFPINGAIETYGGETDPFMIYIGIQCAVNGSEYKPRGIGRFFRPWNSIKISDEPYMQVVIGENGEKTEIPHNEGSIILYYSDTDNGGNSVRQTAQSYKPNGLDDRIQIYNDAEEYKNENQP